MALLTRPKIEKLREARAHSTAKTAITVWEQYMLAACVEFHRQRLRQPGVAYVFESPNEAFDESAAARVGYTHLIGGAKANRAIASRLDRRVRRDFREFHARAARIAEAIE